MDRSDFEAIVAKAVESLPEDLLERLENIDIVVDDEPTSHQLDKSDPGKGYVLLGLYEGIPLTKRNTYYGNVTPDKITIFQKALEEKCGNDEFKLRAEIGKVVRHEIAHNFGIDDDRLRELKRY